MYPTLQLRATIPHYDSVVFNGVISRNITGFVKTLRLKWMGHFERMYSGRKPKMILKARMEGGRKMGRPRKRWLDDAEHGLQKLGV
jgi:hypothetical protein